MTDKTITNEKMTKDKFTISISPELHSALMLASIDKDISLSKIIESYLKNSNKFKKYIKEASYLKNVNFKGFTPKDKFTISISHELHNALILASIDKDISVSKIIEYYLKNSNKFKKYIKEAKNYAKAEEGINPAAIGSDYIQKHIQDLKNQKR